MTVAAPPATTTLDVANVTMRFAASSRSTT